MSKRSFIVLLLIVFISAAKAQTIDTAALRNYPSSVIVKVYEVADKTNLTTGEQQLLANLFSAEEEELKSLIMNGAVSTALDSVKASYVNSFHSLLSLEQIGEYYNAKVAGKAHTIARLTAGVLQEKYNIDSVFRGYFNQIYTWRESLIEKIWLQYTDTVSRNNNLKTVIAAYDTLLGRYLTAAAANRYIAGRVYLVDSLLPIEQTKKTELLNDYYNRCMQYRNRAYADNFNRSFNAVFDLPEDTAYYAIAYQSDIIQATGTAVKTSLAGYLKTYKLSAHVAEQITPYLAQRERAIALVNKLYPDFSNEKDELIDEVLAVYQPVIDSLIALDGDIFRTSQIDIAIRFAQELGLDSSQLSQLQEALSLLSDLREAYLVEYPYGEFDSKVFESESLNDILTPEQYTQVLTVKLYGKSAAMARLDWEYILLYDMVTEYGFPEAATQTELTNYHLAVLIAYYRNANDLEEQYLSVQRINEVMPEAMQLLLEQWAYMTPYGDVPGVFFQW